MEAPLFLFKDWQSENVQQHPELMARHRPLQNAHEPVLARTAEGLGKLNLLEVHGNQVSIGPVLKIRILTPASVWNLECPQGDSGMPD